MGKLSDLPNIGPVIEGLLLEAGIESKEKLVQTGSREAFLRIRAKDPTACLHMLYGLEGAVQGVNDKYLPEDVKKQLKKFFNAL